MDQELRGDPEQGSTSWETVLAILPPPKRIACVEVLTWQLEIFLQFVAFLSLF